MKLIYTTNLLGTILHWRFCMVAHTEVTFKTTKVKTEEFTNFKIRKYYLIDENSVQFSSLKNRDLRCKMSV